MLITNAGPDILSTNYWDTEHAAQGLVYLSVNASAIRLLVPPVLEPAIAEMATGRLAIISAGPDEFGRMSYGITFEDGTDSPYCLLTQNFDRLVAERRREGIVLTVWTRPAVCRVRLPACFRRVDRVPCLEGWD